MNINLILNHDAVPIEGHENVLIENLNSIAPNTCTGLLLNQTLQYIGKDELQMLLSKIRHGGIITISCLDIVQVAGALYHGNIDSALFSSMTLGTRSQHSLLETKQFFEQQGYIVQAAGIQDLSFYIKAQRP